MVPTGSRAAICLSLLTACSGAQDRFGDYDWSEDQHHRVAGREARSLFESDVVQIDRSLFVLRGVRHDVSLSGQGALTARCRCLDVVVGRATEARFEWAAEVPEVAPDDAVVAIRTKGSQCAPTVSAKRRPSIQAVDVTDGNVIITVEELALDRPQALGAVVPSPAVDGGLYIRSAKSTPALPYAHSKASHGMCLVLVRRMSAANKN
jgi:hypothetical protein